MFDPALVVTWTATALTDPTARSGAPSLSALVTRIHQQLGDEALRALQSNPFDPAVREGIRARIERSAYYDPAFSQDLTRLQHEIDQQKIRARQPPAPGPARALEGPTRRLLPARPPASAAEPGVVDFGVRAHAVRTPWFVKALITAGVVAMLGGFVDLGAVLLDDGGAVPTYATGGLILLVAGLAVLVAGTVAARLTRRR